MLDVKNVEKEKQSRGRGLGNPGHGVGKAGCNFKYSSALTPVR